MDLGRNRTYYQELQVFDLDSGNVGAWLKDWSDLTRHVFEIQTRLSVRTTVNTADEEGEKLYAHFLDTIFPKSQEAENALNQKLLASKLEPNSLRITLRNIRAEADLFRKKNLPLLSEEQKLGLEYNKNKAPGGYCTMFPVSHRPFIFMNSVGTHADVKTLLHEGGHSFHTFGTAGIDLFHNIKYSQMEFNEVASASGQSLPDGKWHVHRSRSCSRTHQTS